MSWDFHHQGNLNFNGEPTENQARKAFKLKLNGETHFLAGHSPRYHSGASFQQGCPRR